MAEPTSRLLLKETSYMPPRGLIFDDELTLIKINSKLKPWGFRLRYWGYEAFKMYYVYQFVTTKPEYCGLMLDKVILYHHADMTAEEWLSELKSRLYAQRPKDYENARRRNARAEENRAKNYVYKRRRKA